jgi:hypothetical protein
MHEDPIGALLEELLSAHDGLQERRLEPAYRAEAATSHGSRRVRRAAHRGWRATAVVSLAVITLISAAAAFVVETRVSAPLSGTLPRQLLGVSYSLQVGPDLVAGEAAWCATLHEASAQRSLALGPGHCEAPQGPVIAQGGLVVVSAVTGAANGWLLYAIVDQRVDLLTVPGGTRVIPIHQPQLPPDWTAAVTIQVNPKNGIPSASAVALTPLGSQGHPLLSALRPTAETPRLPVRPVNPLRPPSHGCAIEVQGASGLRLGHAWALRGLPPARPSMSVAGFLSCYSLTFEVHGQQGVAAILLDASQSGAGTPAEIPGTRSVPGEAGVAIGPGGEDLGFGFSPRDRLVVERISGGWLVVQTAAAQPSGAGVLRLFRGRA